jgi:hypothetical protein
VLPQRQVLSFIKRTHNVVKQARAISCAALSRSFEAFQEQN